MRLALGSTLLLAAACGAYGQEAPVKPVTPATAAAPAGNAASLPGAMPAGAGTSAASSAQKHAAIPTPASAAASKGGEAASPATVSRTIPTGTRIAVVLDVPVSTRISHKGQIVRFRTTDPLMVDGQVELPSDSLFGGKLLEVRKPGRFSKEGHIVLAVDTLELADGSQTPISAKLEASDPLASGKGTERSKAATILSTAMWTAEGALLGLGIDGGQGAAVGAGAGGAISVAVLMSKRGHDVYLEPGTPFQIRLDQQVTFQAPAPTAPTAEVAGATATAGEANEEAASAAATGTETKPAAEATATPTTAAIPAGTPANPSGDPDRPELKQRPKPDDGAAGTAPTAASSGAATHGTPAAGASAGGTNPAPGTTPPAASKQGTAAPAASAPQ